GALGASGKGWPEAAVTGTSAATPAAARTALASSARRRPASGRPWAPEMGLMTTAARSPLVAIVTLRVKHEGASGGSKFRRRSRPPEGPDRSPWWAAILLFPDRAAGPTMAGRSAPKPAGEATSMRRWWSVLTLGVLASCGGGGGTGPTLHAPFIQNLTITVLTPLVQGQRGSYQFQADFADPDADLDG